MKKSKLLTAVASAVVLASTPFIFSACGNDDNKDNSVNDTEQTPGQTEQLPNDTGTTTGTTPTTPGNTTDTTPTYDTAPAVTGFKIKVPLSEFNAFYKEDTGKTTDLTVDMINNAEQAKRVDMVNAYFSKITAFLTGTDDCYGYSCTNDAGDLMVSRVKFDGNQGSYSKIGDTRIVRFDRYGYVSETKDGVTTNTKVNLVDYPMPESFLPSTFTYTYMQYSMAISLNGEKRSMIKDVTAEGDYVYIVLDEEVVNDYAPEVDGAVGVQFEVESGHITKETIAIGFTVDGTSTTAYSTQVNSYTYYDEELPENLLNLIKVPTDVTKWDEAE